MINAQPWPQKGFGRPIRQKTPFILGGCCGGFLTDVGGAGGGGEGHQTVTAGQLVVELVHNSSLDQLWGSREEGGGDLRWTSIRCAPLMPVDTIINRRLTRIEQQPLYDATADECRGLDYRWSSRLLCDRQAGASAESRWQASCELMSPIDRQLIPFDSNGLGLADIGG